eukprot:5752569-Amphidinium_carterae.1
MCLFGLLHEFAPEAARPRVRVTVKPKQTGEAALPVPSEAGSNAGNGLGLDGYESDTSEAADTRQQKQGCH